MPHFKVQRPSAIPPKDAAAASYSYTAARSRSGVKSEVLKGPRGVFLSVDLSSDAGNHRGEEMKGLLEY